MFRFVPYVLKSLWRHRARTLLTVSGAAVALFVFCFVGSVREGLARLTGNSDARRTLVVFQENRFCPTSSRLPEDYARRIEKITGVRDVVPLRVWTNNCRASLDVIVFNGAPPKKLRSTRNLRLIAGNWGDFESRRDGALVGKTVARRRGLSPGNQFSIGDLSVNVVGIFASSVPAEENLIYTSLEFLQYTRGLDSAGLVTQFEVYLTDEADPEAVGRAVDAALQAGPVATTTRRKGAFQASTLADFVDLVAFANWLGYACVGLVLALVMTTTVMAVQDRIREHAMLQTLGLRPARVFRLVVLESTLMCLVGGITGTAAALAMLGSTGLAIGAEGVTVAFRPSWQLAATGTAVSLGVGVAAGLVPAWQAARTEIVTALQS